MADVTLADGLLALAAVFGGPALWLVFAILMDKKDD